MKEYKIKVKWLYDNAISLNKRRYPAEAVNKLIQTGQEALKSNRALTCYIGDSLVGEITDIWREDIDAFAYIKIKPWASYEIIKGDYRPTLRASDVELRSDSDVPAVAGEQLRLDGIDFTPNPAIEGVEVLPAEPNHE